jgi:hypothetical protein
MPLTDPALVAVELGHVIDPAAGEAPSFNDDADRLAVLTGVANKPHAGGERQPLPHQVTRRHAAHVRGRVSTVAGLGRGQRCRQERDRDRRSAVDDVGTDLRQVQR